VKAGRVGSSAAIFFDVIDLGNDRMAVALGDVSGKGVEASVLMTATQGFLHAALQLHGEPARAVTAANAFVAPRRPDCRFVTLWVAVLDPARSKHSPMSMPATVTRRCSTTGRRD